MKLKLFLLGIVLAVFICSCTNNDEIYDDSTRGNFYTADDYSGVLNGRIASKYQEDDVSYIYINIEEGQLKHPDFKNISGVSVPEDEMPCTSDKLSGKFSFRVTKIYKVNETSDYQGYLSCYVVHGRILTIVGSIEICD